MAFPGKCSLAEGCDIVISTLGKPKGENSVFGDATKNIIRAVTLHGIKKYIVTTDRSQLYWKVHFYMLFRINFIV